mgnify:CR=1 FL=1
MTKNLYYILFYIFLVTGCKQNHKDNIKSKQSVSSTDHIYTSVEFYCFCMAEKYINNRSVLVTVCGEKEELTPEKLIRKEHFFDTISDSDRLSRFSFFFNNNSRIIIKKKEYPDARFVFLVKDKTAKTDTFYWKFSLGINDSTVLNCNKKYLIKYPFNIIDSIKVLLNKRTITCDIKSTPDSSLLQFRAIKNGNRYILEKK